MNYQDENPKSPREEKHVTAPTHLTSGRCRASTTQCWTLLLTLTLLGAATVATPPGVVVKAQSLPPTIPCSSYGLMFLEARAPISKMCYSWPWRWADAASSAAPSDKHDECVTAACPPSRCPRSDQSRCPRTCPKK